MDLGLKLLLLFPSRNCLPFHYEMIRPLKSATLIC